MARTEYSPTARNVFRVLGVVLVLGGIFLAVHGGFAIADATPSDEEFFAGDNSGPGFAQFAQLAGGLFMFVFGIGALNAGFLGAQANYVAGETSPAVRQFGSAFRGDDDGHSGSEPKSGKFCSECGVRNDGGARFCDSCGHALASA
ncbi:hypothetical protein BH11ACT8_BH11ACT8_13920 [soil metagenome]